MERGIEGSLLDLECVARDLLDSLRDGIAVNGPSPTTLMMRRSSVPCGRSNLSAVFFMPMASTYASPDVEGQGISAVSMPSGQLSVRPIRKLGSAVTIKGKSLIKADLDSCERIGIGKRRSIQEGGRPAEMGNKSG